MKKKVLLISIDGMRPDGLQQCGNPCVKELEKLCAYTYSAKAVMPSMTLPCHFSMAHSVTPYRHGILTNTYVPQVRPVKGIFEKIREAGGKSAMYYCWEQLRDIAQPSSLRFATFIHVDTEGVDTLLADEAEKRIKSDKPDFVFLYMGNTDHTGHAKGWMSEEYLQAISTAIGNAKRMIEEFGEEYSVIIMADHGGHERIHGTELPEDMTIPLFFYGEEFKAGQIEKDLSLLDIAPTIAALMGVMTEPEWEGQSVVE